MRQHVKANALVVVVRQGVATLWAGQFGKVHEVNGPGTHAANDATGQDVIEVVVVVLGPRDGHPITQVPVGWVMTKLNKK